MGLTLGKNLKLYTSVAKGLKLKARMFLGLNPTFVEVTKEKLVRGAFLRLLPSPPILNRVKAFPRMEVCSYSSMMGIFPKFFSIIYQDRWVLRAGNRTLWNDLRSVKDVTHRVNRRMDGIQRIIRITIL